MPWVAGFAPPSTQTPSGRSSGVEHNLAKVGVEGSNPFARSSLPISPFSNRRWRMAWGNPRVFCWPSAQKRYGRGSNPFARSSLPISPFLNRRWRMAWGTLESFVGPPRKSATGEVRIPSPAPVCRVARAFRPRRKKESHEAGRFVAFLCRFVAGISPARCPGRLPASCRRGDSLHRHGGLRPSRPRTGPTGSRGPSRPRPRSSRCGARASSVRST